MSKRQCQNFASVVLSLKYAALLDARILSHTDVKSGNVSIRGFVKIIGSLYYT